MKTERYRIPRIDTNADYVQFKLRFNRRTNKSANMFLSFSFYESVIKKKYTYQRVLRLYPGLRVRWINHHHRFIYRTNETKYFTRVFKTE